MGLNKFRKNIQWNCNLSIVMLNTEFFLSINTYDL